MYEWNSDSCYVGFFDILGYKELITKNPHKLLKTIHSHSIPTSINSTMPHARILIDKGKPFVLGNSKNTDVQSVMVSDSTIIWTRDDSPNRFLDIIYKAASIIVEGLFKYLPVRGAISVGPLSCTSIYHDQQPAEVSVFGLPIVDCYELQSNTNWVGCVLSSKADTLFQEKANKESFTPSLKDLVDKRILERYEVPLKNGPVKQFTTTNWTLYPLWQSYTSGKELKFSIRELISKTFSHFNKNADEWRVRQKIVNTLEYISHMTNADLDRKNWPYATTLPSDLMDSD